MKKFISAITSVATLASAMAVAAPAAVNAIEDSKTIYLSTVTDSYNAGSSEITVTADDLKSGDKTIRCGLFLQSGAKQEITAIQALWGVKGSDSTSVTVATVDGASGSDIINPYFSKEQSFTNSLGQTWSSKCLPFFAGELEEDEFDPDAGTIYSVKGNMVALTLENEEYPSGEKIANKFVSYVWSSPYGDKSWLGAKSDEFPAYYFDVVISKNAKAGDYVIDFYDFYTDEKGLLPSTLLGSTQSQYEYTKIAQAATGEGLLNMKPMTVHVTNGDTPTPTEAPKTEAPQPTQAQPTQGGNVEGDGCVFSFDKDVYEVDASEKDASAVLKVMLDTHGQLVSGVDIAIAIEGDLINSVAKVYDDCPDANATYTSNTLSNYVAAGNAANTFTSKNGTVVSLKANAPIGTTNSDGTYKSLAVTPDSYFLRFAVKVPKGTAAGDYAVTIPFVQLAGNRTDGETIDTIDLPTTKGSAIIRVKGDAPQPTEEPKTEAPQPTEAPKTEAPQPTEAQPGTRKLGDANCDGTVNVADVVMLNRHLAKTTTLKDQGIINADVDKPVTKASDAKLTYADSQYIIKAVIGLYELTDNGPVATGDKGTTDIVEK